MVNKDEYKWCTVEEWCARKTLVLH